MRYYILSGVSICSKFSKNSLSATLLP